MKVLFCALHFGYFRNFESVIRELAERGHHVHLSADEPDALGGVALVERLSAEQPRITFGLAPSLDREPWFRLARKLRLAADYIRFHEPAFAGFGKTRLNLVRAVPRGVLAAMNGAAGKNQVARRAMSVALNGAEAMMPLSETSRAYIEAQDPDVVLLASVTLWRAPQLEHLRAARALGRRTAVCVFSWDQLSSKALLRVAPDRVFVWNETQKQEAVGWHGMPASRVAVTGAQCYDQWFGRTPSRDRAAFCAAVGLDPGRPFLLYVCSVMTPDPREADFVLRWIEAVRASDDPALREAGILVRPHPERMREWSGVSLERFGNVALYGSNPISPDAQRDYFDSLFHSHAVVGLVTSAFIEAAVVGRPVHALVLPEFAMYTEGMQHFRYLVDIEGGVLQVTRTFAAHLAALAATLAHPVARDEQNVRFVRAFVRPRGLDVAATPVFADAVEDLARQPAPARVSAAWQGAVAPAVHRIAESAEHGWLRPVFCDTQELESDRSEDEKAAFKAAAAAERSRRIADKERLLASRRRERRRTQLSDARRKHIARVKGRLKSLVGLS